MLNHTRESLHSSNKKLRVGLICLPQNKKQPTGQCNNQRCDTNSLFVLLLLWVSWGLDGFLRGQRIGMIDEENITSGGNQVLL